MGRRQLLAGIAAFGIAATALVPAAAGASTGSKKSPAPEGLPAFYSVPAKFPSNKPGTLIKSQKIDTPEIDGTVYRVMYVTKSLQDKPIPVTGVIIVPEGDAPDGGWPVLSWAHGTNGMADQCAGSLHVKDAAPAANDLLARGWLLAATDYEGEGTPGLHPYIAGENSARDTVDIVRAARQLRGAHPSKRYVVWGHSQGGHTAMFTLKFAQEYAPELQLEAVVAGAPPSQFKFLYDFLVKSTFKHYLLMAAGGLNAAYGDEAAPLDEVLTPQGIDLLPLLEQGCSGYVAEQTADVEYRDVTKGDPFEIPAWQKIIEANDPQSFTEPIDTPLLIIQGGNDEQIPVASTQLLTDHLCGIGQGLERWVYPGQTHAGVIVPSLADMIHWIDDRFTGEAAPGSYTPTGQPDVQITGCPG